MKNLSGIADQAKPRAIVGRLPAVIVLGLPGPAMQAGKATPACPAFAEAASRRQAKRNRARESDSILNLLTIPVGTTACRHGSLRDSRAADAESQGPDYRGITQKVIRSPIF
jgi:hypothetical protein